MPSLGLILSCNKPDNFIIETDIEQISLNASKNGLTVEENGRLGISFSSIINTTNQQLSINI